MNKYAKFNDEMSREYRYLLRYRWNSAKIRVLFIMLNPSTADQISSDPTVNNCIEYAKQLNGGILEVINLFSFVSSTPDEMFEAAESRDIVGVENDKYIFEAIGRAHKIVVAWGSEGHAYHRNHKVLKVLEQQHKTELLCLGYTKFGHPAHPGYIQKADKTIVDFVY